MIGLGLSGFTSFAYEIYWTRSLVFLMGNSTYAVTTMLTAFLVGIALAVGATLATTGCTRLLFGGQSAQLGELCALEGVVVSPTPVEDPIVVVLFAERDGRLGVIDHRILPTPSRFRFVTTPGQFQVAAFVDAGGDLVFIDYGAAEWAMYGSDICRTFPASGRFTARNSRQFTHCSRNARS